MSLLLILFNALSSGWINLFLPKKILLFWTVYLYILYIYIFKARWPLLLYYSQNIHTHSLLFLFLLLSRSLMFIFNTASIFSFFSYEVTQTLRFTCIEALISALFSSLLGLCHDCWVPRVENLFHYNTHTHKHTLFLSPSFISRE